MEVHFSVDLQEKLNRVAAQQGRDSESLVREAVERSVDSLGRLLVAVILFR